MEEKKKITAQVMEQKQIGTEIYSMWLKVGSIAKDAKPGQFLSLYCKDGSRVLPRPISICEIEKEKEALRIVYRVAGKGTEEFSRYQEGDQVELMGPLGNGFPLTEKKAFLIGGGIGIPPMLELAKQLNCKKEIVLGYRDELFLTDEFSQYGNVTIATEDGSTGTKGNVLDAIREKELSAPVLFACGPTPMLKAIKAFAKERNMKAWISLEERMACGIGVCLSCVCKSTDVDEHTNVNNKRVCKDGPVFRAEEVDF